MHAIVQARMASKRLPGKVLKDFFGAPMIKMILDRISKSKKINKIIVAITDNPIDNILNDWLINNSYKVFRGNENDVLERFYKCSKFYNSEDIVRITADDPFKDHHIIDEMIDLYYDSPELDYLSNSIYPSFPEGLDIEIFSFEALSIAYKNAKMKSEREHVTPYIWKNPNKFNIANFKSHIDLSSWRMTVDRAEDLEFMNALMKLIKYNKEISFSELREILISNTYLKDLNSNIPRNEGYNKTTLYD